MLRLALKPSSWATALVRSSATLLKTMSSAVKRTRSKGQKGQPRTLPRAQGEPPSRNRREAWISVRSSRPREATGQFTGKWMPRVPAEIVDEVWNSISAATLSGDLGIAAKVSTLMNNELNPRSEGRNLHLICVYTADCRDVEDVARVLVRLRSLGFTQRLSYKEDGATYANVYGAGAALYVAQPRSSVPELRRDPIPTPLEYVEESDADA
jgi:hypothetical protein